MAKNTKIAWATSTFNGWIGCTYKSKSGGSPACARCYAETWAKRMGRDFATPKLTSDANWKKPLKWNEEAAKQNEPWRVFAFSLGDVFDLEVGNDWRRRFFTLVNNTPNLIWMVLTKQEEQLEYFMDDFYKDDMPFDYPFPNLWLGVTVENQEQAKIRIPYLLRTNAVVRFLSVEPMLEQVDIGYFESHITGGEIPGIDWVICGAETGPGARPMDPMWAVDLRSQCRGAEVPFFMKKMSGGKQPPPNLMIREFPK